MAKHGSHDDGAQGRGKFSTMDSPLNITTEGGDAPKGDNLVPTSNTKDPLGILSSLTSGGGGGGAKSAK